MGAAIEWAGLQNALRIAIAKHFIHHLVAGFGSNRLQYGHANRVGIYIRWVGEGFAHIAIRPGIFGQRVVVFNYAFIGGRIKDKELGKSIFD